MSHIGKPERETQRRVIALFRDELGYRFLGDWTDRDGNSNIEEKLLTDYLRDKGGYSPAQISAAIYKLTTEANNSRNNILSTPWRLFGFDIVYPLRRQLSETTAGDECMTTVRQTALRKGRSCVKFEFISSYAIVYALRTQFPVPSGRLSTHCVDN